MQRREFIKLIAVATAAWPIKARAQAAKTLLVGFLYPGPQAAAVPRMAALLEGLKAGGYRADQINLTPRIAAGKVEQLTPMAAELVAGKVDLIVAISPAAVRAAKSATTTIPIAAN